MVETANYSSRHSGLVRSGSSELLIPDGRLRSRDVMERFGFDYRQKAHRKLLSHGIIVDMRELHFFETPKPHLGSQALYFLQQKIGNHRVYVSYIPENGKSTEHMHDIKHKPDVIEIYDSMGGLLRLLVDDMPHEISEAGGPFVVSPGHFHQVHQPESNDSINLIILKDSAGIPDEEVHIGRQK